MIKPRMTRSRVQSVCQQQPIFKIDIYDDKSVRPRYQPRHNDFEKGQVVNSMLESWRVCS